MSRGLRIAIAASVCAVSVGGVALAALLAVSSSKLTAWSSAVSCAAGTVTAAANADSYISEASPNTNFDGQPSLRVSSPLVSALGVDLGGRVNTLVRFTLPDLGLCSVTSATLRLYATSAASGRTLRAARVTSAWDEATVDWNDGTTVTSTGATTTTSGTGWREWSATAMVQAMYPGSNHGFMVQDTGTALLAQVQVFDKRGGGGNPPQLVITYG